jgi:hypothetical protein
MRPLEGGTPGGGAGAVAGGAEQGQSQSAEREGPLFTSRLAHVRLLRFARGGIMCSISWGLKIATFTLFFAANSIVVLPKQSFADVQLTEYGSLAIVGTISKSDVDYVIQYAIQHKEEGHSPIYVGSPGGDVDAAMKIGQIIRENEWTVTVPLNSECLSSCALIYIAGVSRINVGLIGLHRPYFSSAPLSRQAIEREVPLMLQKIKDYVHSMGVTDLFYQEMVNAEPSNIRLYSRDEIKKLVPDTDPTYDEITTSYQARRYGIDTATMRHREQDADNKCTPLIVDLHESVRRFSRCKEAALWGLSERVYEERTTRTSRCIASDEEVKALKKLDRRIRSDSPIILKHEECIRNVMLGRWSAPVASPPQAIAPQPPLGVPPQVSPHPPLSQPQGRPTKFQDRL